MDYTHIEPRMTPAPAPQRPTVARPHDPGRRNDVPGTPAAWPAHAVLVDHPKGYKFVVYV